MFSLGVQNFQPKAPKLRKGTLRIKQIGLHR